MFSVIIPVYNKEHFVAKSIQSVLNQTFEDFEIIIVNDGSIDSSLDVILGIHDRRIKVINKENEGVSIARNTGVKHVSHDYVCFLDADDEWPSNFLQIMNETIKKYPSYRLFSCPYMLKRKTCEDLYAIGEEDDKTCFVIDDYCASFIKYKKAICCVGTVCVRLDLLNEVGLFPPKVKRGEDHDLWLRLACREKFVYTKSTYLIYNIDSENNSRSNYRSYKDSFPYWRWYDYPYFNKRSLYKFTSYFILSNAITAIKNIKLKSALIMFLKLRVIF